MLHLFGTDLIRSQNNFFIQISTVVFDLKGFIKHDLY